MMIFLPYQNELSASFTQTPDPHILRLRNLEVCVLDLFLDGYKKEERSLHDFISVQRLSEKKLP